MVVRLCEFSVWALDENMQLFSLSDRFTLRKIHVLIRECLLRTVFHMSNHAWFSQNFPNPNVLWIHYFHREYT